MKGKKEQFTCPCGKEFKKYLKPSQQGRALERFCSKDCSNKYSWYGRHAWLYNRDDLKQLRQQHSLYKK